jgi:hypothetical protein
MGNGNFRIRAADREAEIVAAQSANSARLPLACRQEIRRGRIIRTLAVRFSFCVLYVPG